MKKPAQMCAQVQGDENAIIRDFPFVALVNKVTQFRFQYEDARNEFVQDFVDGMPGTACYALVEKYEDAIRGIAPAQRGSKVYVR